MTHVSTNRASVLTIVRLNNYRSIRAAYGEDVARGAMAHLRASLARQLSALTIAYSGEDEIEVVAGDFLPRSMPTGMLVETLCASIAAEPFHIGDDAVILSLSAGCGTLRDGARDEESCGQGRVLARAQLNASINRPDSFNQWGAAWEHLYRADMAAAVQLLEDIRSGVVTFAWRSVGKLADPLTILHHEGHLSHAGGYDCEEAYKALERLELVHLADQHLIVQALEELKFNPMARICVPVSAQSLSLNLFGKGAGWTELRQRLSRDRALARRLVLQVSETSQLASMPEAQRFVCELREFGVRIGLSRFGASHASVGELLALAPDMIKLDELFLRTAPQSDRHCDRVGHLLGLAASVCDTVIVDGADTSEHLALAEDQGAEWVVGKQTGHFSNMRAWYAGDIVEVDALPVPQALWAGMAAPANALMAAAI